MRINAIEMRNFMSHAHTRLNFPARGIVLLQGSNGSGKSAISEALSVAFWNKTLRGQGAGRGLSLWAGEKGSVEIQAAGLSVIRTARGKLVWAREGAEPVKFENGRKAQEALETAVGEHDVWSRVSVFSSQDASPFSTATDSERKRLLESLLGLSAFDAASDACRKDLRASAALLEAARAEVSVLEERVQGLEERSQAAPIPEPVWYKGKEVTLETAPAVVARLQKPWAAVSEASRRKGAAESAHEGATMAYARAEQALAAAEAHLAGARRGRCSVCGEPTTPSKLKALAEAHRSAQEALQRQEALRSELASAYAEAREALETARAARETASGVLAQVKAWKQAAEAVAAQRTTLAERLEDAQEELDAARLRVLTEGEIVAELEAADRVLSVGGVRSHILHRALGGIEAVANVWLARLAALGDYALRLSLKPYTEKARGGVKDAISMEVYGAGNGQGYRATSGGERRRIDVALMLALAEIAAARQPDKSAGTLFFDECFDTLDAEGREAVLEVLEEMAEQCCIVLITHVASWPRVEAQAVAHWRVEGGKVSVS